MFLGRIKSGKPYLVAKGDQNQRKIMSRNFGFINKPYVVKEMFYRHFKQKNSTELFVSNCLMNSENN